MHNRLAESLLDVYTSWCLRYSAYVIAALIDPAKKYRTGDTGAYFVAG
jgi:hypothetical protein